MQIAPPFDTPAWRRWLEDLPEAATRFPKEQLIQGGRNQLFRCRHQNVDLVAKRFPNRGAWKKVVYRICEGKAKRSYRHTHRLIEAGLNSPAPVAWLEARTGAFLTESFYVCLFAPFEHEARQLHHPNLPNRDEKAQLLGRSIAKMHQAQILHLDLTPGNLLYAPNKNGGWSIQIVDNNRMRFGPVPLRRATTSLAQADLPENLVPSMLHAYAAEARIPLGDLEKAFRRRRQRYALKWRVKNATRPWRRKIGL